MMVEQMLIDAVKQCISEKIDEEIKNKTNEFYNMLVARKDKYIAEIMSGIRICHESNPETMCVDYKIMFINKYEVTKKRESEPQTKYPCDTCANKGDYDGECRNCISDSRPIRWETPSHYKLKDEPQTERSE